MALRDGVYSLGDLKRQLHDKALKREYTPFEDHDEGLKLYASPTFSHYLGELDQCLNIPGATCAWDPADLGRRYRDRMRTSAETGVAGLTAEDALSIWGHIEGSASGPSHSRTMYYEHARSVTNRQTAANIRRWAESEYIKNFPEALDFDLSMPRAAVTELGAWDPLREVSQVVVTDSATVRGRDCVLLNSSFLENLTINDIERLRRLPEFGHLTTARLSGNVAKARESIISYLKAIGEEAPRVVDPSVPRLEAFVQVKKNVTRLTEIAAIVVSVNEPIAGAALGGLAFLMREATWPDGRLERAKSEAIVKLEAQAATLPVGELHHESANPALPRTT